MDRADNPEGERDDRDDVLSSILGASTATTVGPER
jgi:hypothetical protein